MDQRFPDSSCFSLVFLFLELLDRGKGRQIDRAERGRLGESSAVQTTRLILGTVSQGEAKIGFSNPQGVEAASPQKNGGWSLYIPHFSTRYSRRGRKWDKSNI